MNKETFEFIAGLYNSMIILEGENKDYKEIYRKVYKWLNEQIVNNTDIRK